MHADAHGQATGCAGCRVYNCTAHLLAAACNMQHLTSFSLGAFCNSCQSSNSCSAIASLIILRLWVHAPPCSKLHSPSDMMQHTDFKCVNMLLWNADLALVSCRQAILTELRCTSYSYQTVVPKISRIDQCTKRHRVCSMLTDSRMSTNTEGCD